MTLAKSLLISEIFPPHVGGSGRWFWEIYRRLPAGACVVAAGEHADQSTFDAGTDMDIVRAPLAMQEWGLRSWAGLRGYWSNVRRLKRLVRRRGIKEVHCGRCLPEGVMALGLKWLAGVPYVCYVHGEDINTARNSREHALLVQRVLAGAKFCIANSHNTARLLGTHYRLRPDAVRVLHPGVDTQRFRPARRCDDARERLGWRDRRVVLTVGRLQLRKGQDMLIRALPEIRRRIPDVLYAVVGEGDEREYLDSLASELDVAGQLQFRGETTDEELVQCYQQCDLFALPNREINGDIEGFGMVLLEAQACGRVVLAGASGGTAETMKVGETGWIADCTSPDPLAATIVELLADQPRRADREALARQWTVDQFDWDALARQAAALFAGQPNATAVKSPDARPLVNGMDAELEAPTSGKSRCMN